MRISDWSSDVCSSDLQGCKARAEDGRDDPTGDDRRHGLPVDQPEARHRDAGAENATDDRMRRRDRRVQQGCEVAPQGRSAERAEHQVAKGRYADLRARTDYALGGGLDDIPAPPPQTA